MLNEDLEPDAIVCPDCRNAWPSCSCSDEGISAELYAARAKITKLEAELGEARVEIERFAAIPRNYWKAQWEKGFVEIQVLKSLLLKKDEALLTYSSRYKESEYDALNIPLSHRGHHWSLRAGKGWILYCENPDKPWDVADKALALTPADMVEKEKRRSAVIEAARLEHYRVPAEGMTIASCVRPIAGCAVCSKLAALDEGAAK